MDLTAIAAFTAAGLSLVNVGVSYRLSKRGQLEEWRRGELRPIVARIVTLSRQVNKLWLDSADARHQWLALNGEPEHKTLRENSRAQAAEHWREARKLWDEMQFQVAELDLIAGRPLRDAAKALSDAHQSLGNRLRPAGPCTHPLDVFFSSTGEVGKREQALVSMTRVELGVDQHVRRARPQAFLSWLPHLRQLTSRSAKPAVPATTDAVVGQ